MLVDAHCHPYDLARVYSESEDERRRLGVITAASACFLEEFNYNTEIARNDNNNTEIDRKLFSCYAVHPQFPALEIKNGRSLTQKNIVSHLNILNILARDGKLAAVGEFGFDLYNTLYKKTEDIQNMIFSTHLETALKYELPVVLHVRRAMHKIFEHIKMLVKCKAVIFHSWPGTYDEGHALLRRGVNAYFSFGNIIMLNHKQAMRSCALLPAERLLTETDAPYQPRRGETFSHWADLPLILETAANLRTEAGNKINANELEHQIEIIFYKIFKPQSTVIK